MKVRLVQRLVAPMKEFGPAAGSLYLLDRLLRSVSPRLGLYVYDLMVQPIGAKPLLPAGLTRSLSFVEICKGDPATALMPAREEIKASRFDQGARCLAVYRKGELIGYCWLCFVRYHEDEVRATFELAWPDVSVFDFDLYVMPEHRMSIAFMATWHGVNAFLHDRGIRYTFSRMTRFNLASRRAHARLGSRRVGRALFLQAWQVEVMVSTLAPFVCLTWSRRVRLRLAPDALEGSAAASAPGTAEPRGIHR
jgi:hypothetical protein